MNSEEFFVNVVLVFVCYAYIALIIVVSSKMNKRSSIPQKYSRKFLHMMIGNLPFLIPFFTSNIYPVVVAAPFIPITFFASPHSPIKSLSKKMKGLADITEEGHHLGLVFYSIAYTILALLFASGPSVAVVAAGVLPMAYGDAAASLVGEKFGRWRYKLIVEKSVEGSAAMFFFSFVSFATSLAYFSMFYPSLFEKIYAAVVVAAVATLAEGFSPLGFDNLTVPAFGALAFLLLNGGV